MMQNCPWVIARLGVEEKSRIVARFMNRQDADDSLRLLLRLIRRHDPDCRTTFVVAFITPESELEELEESA